MDKFFEVLKKLRPGVQEGKITRERAKDILMQESGVSEQLASKAADNMMATNPEVSGGITTINREKKLPEPDDPSVEERTSGLLKEGRDYKIGEDGEYISLRDQETGIDPDLAKLGDKESFEYEMALYRQRRKQKMEKVYKQFGAVTEKDKSLVDEYVDMDSEGNFIFSPSNPKYDKSTASIFIQESLEDIAGAEDLARNILYGRVAENIYADEGLEAYINYASKELKKQGLEFNEQLLKRLLKRNKLAGGGRAGFKEGTGKKGILSALVNKLNEIAPGSTNVGKVKKVSDKAKRREMEREMVADFNRFNKQYPPTRTFKGVEIKDPKFDEDMPFDNDAEKLAEIKMSNKRFEEEEKVRNEMKAKYGFTDEKLDEIKNTPIDEEMADRLIRETDLPEGDDFDLEKGLNDLDEFNVTKDAARAKKLIDEQAAPKKAGKGRFTKAQVLENILTNTIKDLGNDPELGEYVNTSLANILKEIKADPSKANNENVFRNLTEQLVNNPNQRIVVYDDDTVDFFTRGQKGGMQGARQIAEEFGISMEEAVKISTMEPEDQVLELTRLRRLKDKNRTLNAGGGLNYLMGL